jgi:hypothetical protein
LSIGLWTFSNIVVLFVTHLSYHPSDVKVKISYLKDSRSDDRASVSGNLSQLEIVQGKKER